jgi:sporulation protein YlmC with PRC-barrel domain
MKINNPYELVGKEVVDQNGQTIGWVDKTWNSWNQDYPGWFFGIKPNDNTRDTYLRGTYKLYPIYSDYIREVTDRVTLNKTMDDLCRYWIKTVNCGPTTCPTDQLVEMPVYDRNHSRVGTFFSWVESGGSYQSYGCLVDPYLCETWKLPNNTLMPIPTNYITYVKDTITLDKTLDELKEYWQQQHRY